MLENRSGSRSSNSRADLNKPSEEAADTLFHDQFGHLWVELEQLKDLVPESIGQHRTRVARIEYVHQKDFDASVAGHGIDMQTSETQPSVVQVLPNERSIVAREYVGTQFSFAPRTR